MVATTLALLGFLVALYLWMWKAGLLGAMVCGTGGCEVVQTSRYAEFLGVPVALIGAAGYLSLLVVGLAGLQPAWLERRGPTLLLLALSGVGVAFTAYLTYLEAAVIRAWCRWCVASAVIITAIFITALLGLRETAPGKREA